MNTKNTENRQANDVFDTLLERYALLEKMYAELMETPKRKRLDTDIKQFHRKRMQYMTEVRAYVARYAWSITYTQFNELYSLIQSSKKLLTL